MNSFVVVLSAELIRRLYSRAFVVGLIFGSIGVALVTRLPTLMESTAFAGQHYTALAGPTALTAPAKALPENNGRFNARVVRESASVPTLATLEAWHVRSLLELSRTGDRLRVLVYAQDPLDVQVSAIREALLPLDISLATNRPPMQVRAELQFPVVVRSVAKFRNSAQSASAHGNAYLLLMLLYLLIALNSQFLLTSVAEEKTSRIAEMLASSVDLTILLSAKIVASTVLALLQITVWVVIGVVLVSGAGGSAAAAGTASLAALPPATAIGFLAFLVLGLLQMAVIFAGAGSLVTRTEDLGAVSGPVFLPVVIAFLIATVALTTPDAPYVVVSSFIPIISPFVMFSRLAISTVPATQLLAALLIDVVCVVLFAIAGGRLYRVGMLLYGRPPSWRQVARAIAYHER